MEKAAADFMIEATGVQKVYAAGGLQVRALRGHCRRRYLTT